MMARYIIKVNYAGYVSSEWYMGRKYVFQGEQYPAIGDMDDAKRYSNRKRADKVAKSVSRLAGGITSCEVMEIYE